MNLIKSKSFYISALCFCAMLIFAAFSDKYTAVTMNGIKLWAISVVPAVFPYFVLTAILTSLGTAAKLSARTEPLFRRMFGVSGLSGYAFFMSVLTGYPSGSKLTAELFENGLITDKEAAKAAGFCSTSGPLFLIGTVGGIMLEDKTVGAVILAAHLLAVILTGIIFRGKTPPKTELKYSPARTDNVIYEAVYESVISLLVLGGIITLYYVLTEMLFDIGALWLPERALTLLLGDAQTARGLITGLFECTKGIGITAAGDSPVKVPLIGLMISFGGLSVMTQSLIFLKRAKIKTAVFLASKAIQAVLCFLILLIFYFVGLV